MSMVCMDTPLGPEGTRLKQMLGPSMLTVTLQCFVYTATIYKEVVVNCFLKTINWSIVVKTNGFYIIIHHNAWDCPLAFQDLCDCEVSPDISAQIIFSWLMTVKLSAHQLCKMIGACLSWKHHLFASYYRA